MKAKIDSKCHRRVFRQVKILCLPCLSFKTCKTWSIPINVCGVYISISPLVATFWINFWLPMISNACEIFASKHRKINIFAWSSRSIGGWNKERIESFVGPFFFSFNLLNWEKSISGLYSLNYKNLNLNNWFMKWLLIFDHLEILHKYEKYIKIM